jgi:hypothetical protein
MDAPNTARCHPPPRTRPVSTIFFSRSVTHVQLGAVVSFPPPSLLHSAAAHTLRHRTRVPRAFDPVEPARFDPDHSPPFSNLRQLAPPVFCCPGTLLPQTFLPPAPCQHRRCSSPARIGDERAAPHTGLRHLPHRRSSPEPNHYTSPPPPVSFLPIHIARCTTAGCAGSFWTQLRPLRRRRQSRRCHLTQATLISALRSCISSAAVKEVCGLMGLSGGFWSVGGPVRPCLGRKRLGGRRAWWQTAIIAFVNPSDLPPIHGMSSIRLLTH